MPAHDTSAAFAWAKIQPPQPRGLLVERRSLEQVLEQALQRYKLTLLLAPAGYGKTAALAQQIRRLPGDWALAWVSADEDDPLQRFLACLTAALEPHDLPWRVAPDALATLALAERGLGEVASELVNALAGAEVSRGLIVIDDAHRIADPQIFALLQRMLERWPVQWGLVIASRVEPPLPLARMRAADELAEFRQADLCFNAAEVMALLDGSGLQATQQDAQALLERTQGWAAGLRLSLATAHSGKASRAGAAIQRHLFDYLATEVLADMPQPLCEFLLRCSVLPELSVARCAHVSGDAQAARWLDEIERRGLFVSVLDPEGPTLRLHDLFRDFLEDRLLREQPEALPLLLRRAAEQEPDLTRQVGYLTRAGAWDEAVLALAQHGSALLQAGGHASLEQMLDGFPQEQFAHQPDLHMLRGITAFTRYDWDTMLDAMQHAEEGYARTARGRGAPVARAYVCSGLHHTGRMDEASAILAELRELDVDDAARAAILYISAWDAIANARTELVAGMVGEMLDCLERIPDVSLWHQCANLGLMVGMPGMAPLLQRFVSDVTRGADAAPTQLRAAAMHIRCNLAIGAGRLDEAWEWLQRADEDCRWLGRPRLLMTDNGIAHMLLHALRGEAEACAAASQQALNDLLHDSAVSHRRVHQSDVLSARARAAWVLQDEAEMRRIEEAMQAAADPFEWAAAPRWRAFARSCVALFEGRLDAARECLEPLALDIERDRFFAGAQARFMLADIQARQGELGTAEATLRPWLDSARQGGDVGGALFAGQPVLRRLAALDWAGRLAPQEAALLRQLASPPGAAVGHRNRPAAPTLPAPADAALADLTERELEVLAHLAAGDSNKLIARAFALSPHTVKRHVANILGKLGVDTRGQAAARFRQAR